MMSLSGKLEKDVKATTANKLLVICIDRDDDLGRKTGISTPVVGRNACIEAAQRLALEDPEDADSNSIFFAVKTYEDLDGQLPRLRTHPIWLLIPAQCV